MALTLLKTPLPWQAAHASAVFEFAYSLDLTGILPSIIVIVQNYGGKVAIYNNNESLTIGNRIYIAQQGSPTLYQGTPVTIVDSVLINSDIYALTDVAWNDQLSAIDIYTLDQIRALQPAFSLYVDGAYYDQIKGQKAPNGMVRLDLSSDLRKTFEQIPPPVLGVNKALWKEYRLDYGVGANIKRGKSIQCLNATIQPTNPTCSTPQEEWKPTDGDCMQSDGVNTGMYAWANLEQYLNGVSTGKKVPNTADNESYVAPVENLDACPLPDPKVLFNLYDPIWQGSYGQVSIADIGGGNPADGVYTVSINGSAYQPLTNFSKVGPNAYALTGLVNGNNTILLRRGSNTTSEFNRVATVTDPAGHLLEAKGFIDTNQGNPRVNLKRRYFSAADTAGTLVMTYDIYRYDVFTKARTKYYSGTATLPDGQSISNSPVNASLFSNLQYEFYLKPTSVSLPYYNLPGESKFTKQSSLPL